jgi:hypothetical protein
MWTVMNQAEGGFFIEQLSDILQIRSAQRLQALGWLSSQRHYGLSSLAMKRACQTKGFKARIDSQELKGVEKMAVAGMGKKKQSWTQRHGS